MNYPNKLTIIAAALFALSEMALAVKKVATAGVPLPRDLKPQPRLWPSLSADEKADYIKTAEYILASTVGADLATFDRTALATALSKQSFGRDIAPEAAIAVAINLHALMV